MSKSAVTFEATYDRYSPVLYGLALEIASTEQEAEEILMSTFEKAYQQKIFDHIGSSVLVTLIKLMIQLAYDKLYPDQQMFALKLKCFENTPMLHRAFCEPKGFECYCNENRLSRADGFRQMRSEFHTLRMGSLVNREASLN
ncbi:MAG: hypothetical protein WKF87_17795 [Chryseolinea sp.]